MTECVSKDYYKMLGRGRGRGCSNKGPFEPARRPGEKANQISKPGQVEVNANGTNTSKCSDGVSEVANRLANSVVIDAKNLGSQDSDKKLNSKSSDSKMIKLLSKYNYKANADQPGGFKELTVKIGQKLSLVDKHPTNEHWWNVQDEDGNQGYVPANYMKVYDDKLTSLPWLQTKKEPEVKEEKTNNVFGAPPKGTWIPYKSAYSDTDKPAKAATKYYCDVCEKSFNGPQPYKAHMASRAHREEVELAAERE